MKIKSILESGERRVERAYGSEYIYNPNIMDVERGNMIRIKGSPVNKNYEVYPDQEDWGILVLDVNYKDGLILVAEYIGGELEFSEWAHIDDVKTTWNIGGYEKAMSMLGAFGNAMNKNLKQREELKQERNIEKHVKFKR